MEAVTDTNISSFGPVDRPSRGGLDAATEDARTAALDADPGPADPTQYHPLRGRLEAVRLRLPKLYRATFVEPFIATLNSLGEADFNQLLLGDPTRERAGGLMMDISQAVLQQGEGFLATATDAFQEVVSDLYDGFLSAEDRRGVKTPDQGVIPPLVKWGRPDFGPYTWPVDATSSFNVQAGVVNLPPANARAGLLAWSALGHETAGHDILHADTGLAEELAERIRQDLTGLDAGLADYWAERIDETASDVMGILNIGPAAGIGLIGYFRGLSAAFGGGGKLRSVGPESDLHPADILRGFLAAEVVSLLCFKNRAAWQKLILKETLEDVGTIQLAGVTVPLEKAQHSAQIVAKTLVLYKAESLEHHALGDIQNWRDRDELKVKALRFALRNATQPSPSVLAGTYAAHVVAAGVVEAISDGAHIPQIFSRMLAILKAMHDKNPAWGPLFVQQPGSISRHRFYVPQVLEPELATSESQPVSPVAPS
ncbi:MAG TPA: hypothetical protein VJV78_07340 [Polyangiales bacterium]|nr:hypothetical protein [Polyangiales bacterium]